MDIKNNLLNLLKECRLICAKPSEKIGLTNKITYKIKFKDPNLVINVQPYRIAHKFQGKSCKELQKLNDEGTISISLSAFNAPIVCIKNPVKVCV